MFSIILQAKEVNKQTAEKAAINAFAQLDNNKNAANFQVKEILTVKSEEKTTFYIVNFSPSGFIIISASDATIPILGSSTESNLSLEILPPQLVYLFDCYKAQIYEVEKQKINATDEIKQQWGNYSSENTSIFSTSLKSATTLPLQVDALLTTTWNQNIGYNRFCPVDTNGPDGHVYAGCVATAMAQILKYWGCKVSESQTHSYDHAIYGTQSVDFNEADYPWDLMVNSPSDQYNAQLIRDCGVSVDMDYGPSGSGAYMTNAQTAFSTFFGFKNTSNYISKVPLYTDSAWKDALKQELSLSRPILYGGFTNSVPAKAHTWVIDGYNSLDQFHCNWGGGGSGDGFYLLTNLTFDNGTTFYNSNNQAVIGLEPVMPNCDEVINGVPIICASGSSFNVPNPNLPIGATVTWQKSTNVTIVSTQPSNPCTFQANATGPGWIEATVNFNGSATLDRKTVWVGPYSSSNYPITGPSSAPCRQYVYYSIPSLIGVSTINWVWPSGWTYVSGQNTTNLALQTGTTGSGGTVGVQALNDCGPGSYATMYTSVTGICGYSLSVSPNPVSNVATIELTSTEPEMQALSVEWELEVYDQLQVIKIKTPKIKDKAYKLNIQGWKDGIYIIRAKIGDDFISEKMMVKH